MNNRVSTATKTKCGRCSAFTHANHFMQCCKIFLCRGCVTKHKCLKSTTQKNKNLCSRCQINSITIQCENCKHGLYCQECFHKTHRMGKFATHKFKPFLNEKKNGDDFFQEKIKEIKEEIQIHVLQYGILEKQIIQKWDCLIHGIEQNFNGLVQEMINKKTELKQKLEMRKKKEIVNFHEVLKNKIQIATEGKNSKEALSKIEHQVRELRLTIEETSEEKFFYNYQLFKKPFEEMKKQIEKMGPQNIIEKQKTTGGSHSKGKNSFGWNGGFSSPLKSSTTTRSQRSHSTAEYRFHSGDNMNKANGGQQRIKQKNFSIKEVFKVKSQKWIGPNGLKTQDQNRKLYSAKKNPRLKK